VTDKIAQQVCATRQPDFSAPITADAPDRHRRTVRFLVSGVPSDSHTWNLIALQLFIEEMGHEVINLGCCMPVDEIVRACRRHRPDCLVVSSVNGYGELDGARIITAVRADRELTGLRAVIGGRFGVRGGDNAEEHADLRQLGFDAVFGGDANALELFRTYIALEVAGQGARHGA
jgi:methylaspartate mutase sigma subunit